MMEKANSRELLLRWLLGELSPEENERVDQQFLADEAFAGRLHEDYIDLLDAYACGELSKLERERVQRAILQSPEQQKNLLFARIFKDRQINSRGGEVEHRWFDISLRWRIAAFAACILVIAVLFLGHRIPSAKQSQVSNVKTFPAAASQSTPKRPTDTPISFALVLSSSIMRGEPSVRTFNVPKNVDVLDIQAVVQNADQQYTMKIINAQGSVAATSSYLIPEQLHSVNFVRFIVPASQLPTGKYRVLVGRQDHDKNSAQSYPMQIAYK